MMLLVFALLFATGGWVSGLNEQEWTDAINTAMAEFNAAYVENRVCDVAEMYTEDMTYLPNKKKTYFNRLGRLRYIVNEDQTTLRKEILTYMPEGYGLQYFTDDYAVAIFLFRVVKYDDSIVEGKGIKAYKLVDGKPLIDLTVWNTNKP